MIAVVKQAGRCWVVVSMSVKHATEATSHGLLVMGQWFFLMTHDRRQPLYDCDAEKYHSP